MLSNTAPCTELVSTNISCFHPNVWNIWCHYRVLVHGGDAPFDAFDLLLSNLTPPKRLEEGSQMLQGFIGCHLHCSTNWSFKLNMTQKETGRGLNLTARKCLIGHSSDVWAMFALLVWSCWGRHGIWITVTSGWAYGWYLWCTTSCVHSIGF